MTSTWGSESRAKQLPVRQTQQVKKAATDPSKEIVENSVEKVEAPPDSQPAETPEAEAEPEVEPEKPDTAKD